MKEKSIALFPVNPAALSTKELLKTLVGDVTELIKTEVALAKAELRRDLKAEAVAATGLGAAALLAYAGIILLFVTAIIALGQVLPLWGAALLVTGLVFAAAIAAAAIGWAKRVRKPMERTRREAQANLAMAKERLA